MMHKLLQRSKTVGFTIVELVVVITVIGILATLAIVSYVAIQNDARTAQMQTDLTSLRVAIELAQTRSGSALGVVTGSWATMSPCVSQPTGTDLAALPRTDACWVSYLSALDKISTASGQNVRKLVDPWGRPYYIDENENAGGGTGCAKDRLGAFKNPYVAGLNQFSVDTMIDIDNSIVSGCA